MNRRPRSFIIFALLLLLAGAILPFLMVIGVLKSTLLLNFAAYIVSVVGLFLGVIGIAMYVGNDRRRNDRNDY